MANQIDFQPQILNLSMYAGDGVKFRVMFKDRAGAPIDVTGTVKAQIRTARLSPDPPVVEFAINDTDAYLGVFVLSLTRQQTTDLSNDPSSKAGKFTGVWDIQWTPDSDEPKTLCQGSVECVADVTR